MQIGKYLRKERIHIDKNFLIKEYSKKSMLQVARQLGCSESCIRVRLKKYNILSRVQGKPVKERKKKCNVSKKFLEKKYSKNRRFMWQIAKELNCGITAVRNALIRYNIPIRSSSESNKINYNFITKDFLIKEYNIKSVQQIAKDFCCSRKVIKKKLIEYGINIRNRKEARHGIKFTEEHKKNIGLAGLGKKRSPETIRKILRRQPITSLELALLNIIKVHNLPYRFVGNGSFNIGRKFPDFVHKTKKIAIEVYNRFFKLKHYKTLEEYEIERVAYFKKFGYKTIMIRDYMINNEEEIVNRLKLVEKK